MGLVTCIKLTPQDGSTHPPAHFLPSRSVEAWERGKRILQSTNDLVRLVSLIDLDLKYLKGVGHEISTSGFVNESVSPWPLSILLGSFYFLMRYLQL
jgi:hypothetical protein